MSLKTVVKVSGVNNLSDARYCAGMGVEMIGFALSPGHERYVEPAKVKEITGWLSGIKIVAEFSEPNEEILLKTLQALDADLIESDNNIPAEGTQKGIIRKVVFTDLSSVENQLQQFPSADFYLLENDNIDDALTYESTLTSLCKKYRIMIGFGITPENISDIISAIQPAGISLKGGDEIKPGLKEFDELSEILELLETEN